LRTIHVAFRRGGFFGGGETIHVGFGGFNLSGILIPPGPRAAQSMYTPLL
jgi:hypothetical protein